MPAKNKDGFGSFIDPKGCFRRSENPAKEKPRNPQNVNVICVNFCAQENITYAATISDRCLCLNIDELRVFMSSSKIDILHINESKLDSTVRDDEVYF